MNIKFTLTAATSGTTVAGPFNISGTTNANVVSSLATGVTKTELSTGYTINGVNDAITGGTIASTGTCTTTTTWLVITPTPTPTPTSTPTPTPTNTLTTGQCYRYRIDENAGVSTSLYGIRYTYPGSVSTDNALNSFMSGLIQVDGNNYYTYSVCSSVEPTWLEMINSNSGSGAVVPNGVFRDGPLGSCTGNAECSTLGS